MNRQIRNELYDALNMARGAITAIRERPQIDVRAYPKDGNGDGVPIEAVIELAVAKARGK